MTTSHMSQAKILDSLLMHRRRLAAGDKLPSITEIAQRAGIHRDTIYALLAGDRISPRSQYALSRIVQEVEEETREVHRTRLMHLQFKGREVQIGFGASIFPFSQRR